MVTLLLKRLRTSGQVFIMLEDSNGRSSHCTMAETDVLTVLIRAGFSSTRAQQVIRGLTIDAFHTEKLDLASALEERLKETVIAGEDLDRLG